VLARRVESEIQTAESGNYGGWLIRHWKRNAVVGDLRTPLYVLLGSAALLLLIAAANIANLFCASYGARWKSACAWLGWRRRPAGWTVLDGECAVDRWQECWDSVLGSQL